MTEGGPAAEFSGSATLFIGRNCGAAQGAGAVVPQPAGSVRARVRECGPASRPGDLCGDVPRAGHSAVMEEGLREKGLAAVIGEVTRLGLTASRRLQLAAETSGVPVFALRRWWNVAEKELTGLPSAAATRWRISPFISHAPPAPGLARARWHVDLLRCRGGEPHSWILEACDAKGRLALPADLADRPDQAPWRRAAAG